MIKYLYTVFLLLAVMMPAMADQAYIQSAGWTVNRLPVLPGQTPHNRCVIQSSFSGGSSVQFVAEDKKIRGAIFIVTEPIFKEAGRNIDVVLSAGGQPFEFPARTLSKYALAVEISDAYQDEFEAKLRQASMIELRSGFDAYNFSVAPPDARVDEALACTPIEPDPVEVVAPVLPAPTPVAIPTPQDTPVAPLQEVATSVPVVIGGNLQATKEPTAFIVSEAGENIPLAEALPMIVPDSYDFRFAQGASAGEAISWDAGSDWLETLVLALSDTDLQVAVNQQTVTILPSLRPVQIPVGDVLPIQRAEVITKQSAENSTKNPAQSFDLSKPPSPGMTQEAKAVLDQLRLQEGDLRVIIGGQAQGNEDDIVAMPPKPIIADNKMQPIMGEGEIEDGEDIVASEREIGLEENDTPIITIYRAKAGENMADVVRRWAEQDGIALELNLQRNYVLARDVMVRGDINLAAEQLLAQFDEAPEAPRLADLSDVEPSDSDIDQETLKSANNIVDAQSLVEQRLDVVANWSAAKDTSLYAALVNWARQGQMQLVWNGDKDRQLPANLQSTTRMGNALEMLLSLYDGQDNPPQIQINRDPDTGLMAMIVTVNNG